MDDEITPRLTLPLLAAGQMQKHATLNEALTRLDALAQAVARSRSEASPPAEPVSGDLWLLPDGTSGAWAEFEAGDLVRADVDGWSIVAAPEGLRLWVADEGRLLVRHAGDWASLGDRLGALRGVERLSLGSEAEEGPALLARLEAALLTARPTEEGGTGDVRLTLNRLSSSGVASLILQTGFSGRAELGLVGDDDLTVRVSPDGSAWTEALRIAVGTGQVSSPAPLMRRQTTVLTADGAWSPPSWARRVEAVLIGGGGGGGGGRLGSGVAASGGGGGGAGGVSRQVWSIADLTGAVTVQVGAGGSGGGVGLAGGHGGDSRVLLGGLAVALAQGGRRGDVSGGAAARGTATGAAGGSGFTGAAGATGQDGLVGPGGGGGGAGVDAAGLGMAAGAGGSGAACGRPAAGGATGSGAGAAGSAGQSPGDRPGGGAAGGASGHGGGVGGAFGGGGGGGGAHPSSPGLGGAGAAGVVILTAEG